MSIHPGKKSNSFTHERTFISTQAVMNKKNFCESCGTSLGFKSLPKLNRHNDEYLEKISDQNTQGVRRSKSLTESEQNRFSDNKTSWLFFPVSSFCDLFMDVPPYLGANNIRKYLREFFSAQNFSRNDECVVKISGQNTQRLILTLNIRQKLFWDNFRNFGQTKAILYQNSWNFALLSAILFWVRIALKKITQVVS